MIRKALVGSTFKLNNLFVTLPVKSWFVWLAKLQKLHILRRTEILEKLWRIKLMLNFKIQVAHNWWAVLKGWSRNWW